MSEEKGMNSFRLFERQTRLLVVAAGLILATIVPVVVSVVVSAAQLTERSIAVTSASRGATNVSYEIKFTSVEEAGAFVVNFCSDTPIIGQACAAPAGFKVDDATTATTDFTTVDAGNDLPANTVIVEGEIGAEDEITVVLDGVNNPTAAGPLYARIVTFNTAANAENYTPTAPGSGRVDDGGAAIAITDTIGVSGAVLETMTFCVSADEISDDCTDLEAPVLALGEDVGTTKALTSSVVSTGSLFTQISTNAASGAVISLKSNALDCGGLLRAGALTACDIAPAQDSDIAQGEAKFGVKTTAATGGEGTLQPVSTSVYNPTTFALSYTIGNSTGVTSTFGDLFLDTAGAPANNKNMELIFGASVGNNTPAGLYSADLSFIATGKF